MVSLSVFLLFVPRVSSVFWFFFLSVFLDFAACLSVLFVCLFFHQLFIKQHHIEIGILCDLAFSIVSECNTADINAHAWSLSDVM